jgi:hypothetical protein
MPTFCHICGKPMREGGGDICEACQENIRAEAVGRHTRIQREAAKDNKKVSLPKGKQAPTIVPAVPDGEEKGPHDFKSMAEYLAYLKKKK